VIYPFIQLGALSEQLRPDPLLVLEKCNILILHKLSEIRQVFVVRGNLSIIRGKNLFVSGIQEIVLVFDSFSIFLCAVNSGL
jgi:hypothetical protein